jgi:hypothetical protein
MIIILILSSFAQFLSLHFSFPSFIESSMSLFLMLPWRATSLAIIQHWGRLSMEYPRTQDPDSQQSSRAAHPPMRSSGIAKR